jgi:hypothetical protein
MRTVLCHYALPILSCVSLFCGAVCYRPAVIISKNDTRFASALEELRALGLHDVRRIFPPAESDTVLQEEWQHQRFSHLRLDQTPENLRYLSLTVAFKTAFQLASSLSVNSSWLLVFEDDVSVNPHCRGSAHAKLVIDNVLRLAEEDGSGLVYLGICGPQCERRCNPALPGRCKLGKYRKQLTTFAKCAGHCTHAMAVATSTASFLLQDIFSPRNLRKLPAPRDRLIIDSIFYGHARRKERFWTAGVSWHAPFDGGNKDHVGLFFQNRTRYSSSIVMR